MIDGCSVYPLLGPFLTSLATYIPSLSEEIAQSTVYPSQFNTGGLLFEVVDLLRVAYYIHFLLLVKDQWSCYWTINRE